MKVLMFGGTGLVGRPIVEKALAAGHNVTLFTRDKSHVKISHQNLRVIEGKVSDSQSVDTAIKGQDVVIQCIGIGGRGNGSKTTVASDANRVITQAMEKEGVKRYIAMSVVGAGDSWPSLPWIYRAFILPLFQKWFVPIIEDKNRMETDIRATNLDWTIVRSTTVKDAPSHGSYTASTDGKKISFTITAQDLADFIVGQIEDDQYIKRAPVICN